MPTIDFVPVGWTKVEGGDLLQRRSVLGYVEVPVPRLQVILWLPILLDVLDLEMVLG